MTTIKLKNGSGAPAASDLVQGEPALDLTNKRLYTEDSGGNVIEVGTNPTSLTTGAFTSNGIDDNADATAITIDSSENVGIGAAPDTTGFGGTFKYLGINGGSGYGVFNGQTSSTTTNAAAASFFGSTTGSSGYKLLGGMQVINAASSASNAEGALTFFTATGGSVAERMRIDSSGNVCVGTTTAAAKVHINGTGDLLRLTSTNSSSGGAQIDLMHFTASPADNDDHGVINFGGYYSGTTQTYGSAIKSVWTDVSARQAALKFFTRNGGTFSEQMRIDSSGRLIIGTTSAINAATLSVEHATFGTSACSVKSVSDVYRATTTQSSGTSYFHYFVYNGSAVGSITSTGSTTAFNTSSDQRLKENIVDAPAGNIDAIRVRSFNWKADGAHQTYGMIAQELAEVAPEAVTQGQTEDDMWGVDYSKLVPVMIKEIQDLRARVAQLEGA